MWISTVVMLLLLLLVFYLYRSRNKNYWEKRGVPTASGYNWFFGHYKQIIFGGNPMFLFNRIYNEFPNDKVVGFLKMDRPGLLIKDPANIKAVLATDFVSFSKNEFTAGAENDILLGNNPFMTFGEEWKVSRSHVTPSLTYAKLKGYLHNMVNVADIMLDHVKGQCDHRGLVEMDLKDLSSRFTADIFGNAVCGIKNNSFENKHSLFADIVENLFTNNVIDMMKMTTLQVFPSLHSIIKLRFSSKKVENIFLNLTRKVIKERAASGEKRNDAFQALLSHKENDTQGVFTDEYIASKVFTIALDLCETAGAALSFVLYELAWHYDIQDKLRAELADMKTKNNWDYNIDDIENFQYLDMVVSESLRLLTPASTLTKLCTTNYKMQVEGRNEPLMLPKNTIIGISIFSIHRDPKYYPEPEKFDPERFTEAAIESRPKFTFFPFADGPRKCPGQRIALLEIKLAVLKIVENFRLKPCAKTNYPLEFDPVSLLLNRPLKNPIVYFEKIQV